MARAPKKGLALASFDDVAPEDWDPEHEELGVDSHAAASLKRAKGACLA